MDSLTGAGKFNPGKQINKPSSAEEAGQIRTDVSTTKTVGTPAEAGAAETTQAPVVKKPEVNRQYTSSDIRSLLLKLEIPMKEPNGQIMTSIMEHGLAASTENFDNISRLLKGRKDARSIQSAVLSVVKGLKTASKSVDVLSAFLKGDHQGAQIMNNAQQQLLGFSDLLKNTQNLFDKGLHSGIASIVSELDDAIKKYGKKNKDLSLSQLQRKNLFTDLKTFSEFLSGVKDKAMDNSKNAKLEQNKAFLKGLGDLQKSLAQVLNNLSSQAILSKESIAQVMGSEHFAYWQIPNPMATTPKTMDLLISKRKKGKKEEVDPKKVRVVLKFDTPDLGEVGVELDVLDRQVWSVFYAKNTDSKLYINQVAADLKDRLSAMDYDLVAYQVKNKPLNIKKLLFPTFNLDKMSHISTEI